MRFEKITENKIRITFNLDDLQEQNIDFHSFMANSIETQEIFLDMLNKAEKEIGFVTKDYRLMIEALATSDGNFILTVTRSLPENIPAKAPQRKLRVRRKNISLNRKCAIYRFFSFEDFCSFCDCFDTDYVQKINKLFTKSSLYVYNSSYYLVLKTNLEEHNVHLQKFASIITEFSSCVNSADLFEKRLLEYGKVIIKDKAFNKVKKFF